MKDLFHQYEDKNKINAALAGIWDNFRNGQENAFVLIYNQFIDTLYNYGERLTDDRELIKDSVQDLFVDLWKNKEKLPQVTSVKYYLFKAYKRKGDQKPHQKERNYPLTKTSWKTTILKSYFPMKVN